MKAKKKRLRPGVLVILDGLGVAPDAEGNAFTRAKTPHLDVLTQRYPTMLLRAAGESVGLPWGEMGNSEVGHITIGAGRVHYQDLLRIDKAIEDKTFFKNKAFLDAIDHVKKHNSTLHIFGILSDGRVHSSHHHCYALLELAKQHNVKQVAVHVFLDGRDALYNSGIDFVQALQQKIDEIGIGQIATISGRFYAMDRDNRWDRTQKTHEALVDGISDKVFDDPLEAIKASYAKEIYDEEFIPVVIKRQGKPVACVSEKDAIIFSHYRSDRARQLTKALILPTFTKFDREYIEDLYFVTMTEYEEGLPVHIAFEQEELDQTLCQTIAEQKMVQLHIAETEKYAHITYFLNGKVEQLWEQEDHVIIPSPRVARYDEQPEMAAYSVTDRVIKELKRGNYDAIFVNFANPDMIAHTGNLQATIEAVEVVDACIEKIAKEVLKQDGFMLVTADHGNAEEVKNLQTGGIDKEHSTNPVPLWIVANHLEGKSGKTGDIPSKDLSRVPPSGDLADIAPTFLSLLGLKIPRKMTGTCLVDE